MTVIELINELNKYDSDTEVLIDYGEGRVNIDEVVQEIGLFTGKKIILK